MPLQESFENVFAKKRNLKMFSRKRSFENVFAKKRNLKMSSRKRSFENALQKCLCNKTLRTPLLETFENAFTRNL